MSGPPTVVVPAAATSTQLVTQRPTRSAACVLVAADPSEACEPLLSALRTAAARVLLARTPFEAVVKATCHEPAFVLLDPSLGRAAAEETRTLLAQCPVTAHIPVELLAGSRALPRRVLASFAA